jgi:hypothetical protein
MLCKGAKHKLGRTRATTAVGKKKGKGKNAESSVPCAEPHANIWSIQIRMSAET